MGQLAWPTEIARTGSVGPKYIVLTAFASYISRLLCTCSIGLSMDASLMVCFCAFYASAMTILQTLRTV